MESLDSLNKAKQLLNSTLSIHTTKLGFAKITNERPLFISNKISLNIRYGFLDS